MTTEAIIEEETNEALEEASEEVATNYIEDVKAIRNDVEQIGELDQTLTASCKDLAEEVMKILRLIDKTLVIEVSKKMRMTVTPNGYVLLKSDDEAPRPAPLSELSPKLMDITMRKLMPKLRESLKEQRRKREELASDLARIRESLS